MMSLMYSGSISPHFCILKLVCFLVDLTSWTMIKKWSIDPLYERKRIGALKRTQFRDYNTHSPV